MSTRFRWTMAAHLACALTAAPAAAEDARQIFDTAMQRYEQRVASIDSLSIVQEVMGVESTIRLEKQIVDNRPVLVPGSVGKAGDVGSMYRHFEHMAKNGTVKGTEQVDGHPCWVVHVEDIGELDLSAEGSDDFEARDGMLYVDKKDYIVRRMQMNGEATRQGVKEPVSMEMHLRDYREVQGWLHPFETEVSFGGADGGDTPEMAEMRKALAQMKEELAKMPADQREMVEQMMKKRMPQLEEMSEGGKMTIKVSVKEIRVNEPAP